MFKDYNVHGEFYYDDVWIRAVTVADFYHRGGNGPTTAGDAVLCIFIYIILKRKNK